MSNKLHILAFDAIEVSWWNEIMALRSAVFVVEQRCVYLDPDENDASAMHLVVSKGSDLLAYLRIIENDAWHIGRIVVNPSQRGSGIGIRMVKEAIDWCVAKHKNKPIEMSAQVYLSDYYGALGFLPAGKMYLEDGIPHLRMVYQEPLK
ncbi:MAG: GNAT family N-acetyltransferase [Cryomorphaceae bacterium]